jgi:pimeloyl-ACP methyl ester carboxylesterase
VVGGASATVDPAARERLAALAPAVTLKEIPGAGHWVHVDAPEETFTAVERALKE